MIFVFFLLFTSLFAIMDEPFWLSQGHAWQYGTFTWFGGPNDPSMDPGHTGGNCKNNRLINEETFRAAMNSYYFAAPDDIHYNYFSDPQCTAVSGEPLPVCAEQNSCGKCFEVACMSKQDNANPQDLSQYDNVCNPGVTSIVQVVDACPAKHPLNVLKGDKNPCNKIDKPHIDISAAAFAHIVKDIQVGQVHGIFRRIHCSYIGPTKNGFFSAEQTRNMIGRAC